MDTSGNPRKKHKRSEEILNHIKLCKIKFEILVFGMINQKIKRYPIKNMQKLLNLNPVLNFIIKDWILFETKKYVHTYELTKYLCK